MSTIGGLPLRPDGRDPDAIYAQHLVDELTHARKTGQTEGIGVSRTTRGDFIDASSLQTVGGGGSAAIKTYSLFDVKDDYLICLPPPTIPTLDPPLTGTVHFIGSFSDDDFDEDGITILINPDSDPQIKYTPIQLDSYWNADEAAWFVFDGAAWQEMTAASPDSKVYIAKEALHRTSIRGAVIFGTTHGYSYIDGPTETWAAGTAGTFNKTRHDYNGSSTQSQRITPPWMDGEPIKAVKDMKTGATRPTSDEDPTPVAVGLHIFGRSCQWTQKP